MNVKMFGKIKWFKVDKGYGYITGYDEETYYFESLNILEDPFDFKEGVEVKFIPHYTTEIPYADEVEISKEIN